MSEAMKAAVQAYFDLFNTGDAQGIVDLYADDASVTDPVGTPAKEGKEAILAFYTMAVKNGAKLHQTGTTRIAGNSAAFAFEVRIGGAGITDKAVDVDLPAGSMTIHVIDVFDFDHAGKVKAMRAYWGPENIEKH